MLPSNNYDLLLLADWLEEYGSCYDIVKAAAIRNNKYNLNFKNNCKEITDNRSDFLHEIGGGDGEGRGNASGHGWGYGNGIGDGEGHGWGYGFGSCKP